MTSATSTTTTAPVHAVGMTHWIHLAAVRWTRAQLGVASLVLGSLVTISLGKTPAPNSILIVQLIERFPGAAVGLGGALLILSVLAFVIAGHPERPAAPAAAIQAMTNAPPVAAVAPSPPHLPLPPHPASPSTPWIPPAPPPFAPAPQTIPLAPAAAAPPKPYATLGTRGRRWRTIAVAVLILASLALAGFATTLAINASNDYAQAPVSAVTAYCADLTQQDYAHAFELVSARMQNTDGNAEFAHYNKLHDLVDGTVESCQPSGNAQITASRAQVPVNLTRSLGAQSHTYQAVAYLVFEQNAWRLDYDDPAQANTLNIPLSAGTNIGPLAVADDMCEDLVNRNVGLAYATLSNSYHTSRTADAFVRFLYILETPPNPLDLVSCKPVIADYQAQPGDPNIHMVLGLADVSTTSGSSPNSPTYQDTFIKVIFEDATWKVDNFQPCATYTSGDACAS